MILVVVDDVVIFLGISFPLCCWFTPVATATAAAAADAGV